MINIGVIGLMDAISKYDLWWHDFNFICDQVRRAGYTPMMWTDMFWNNKEEFIKRAPRDVVMCNWYYDKFDDLSKAEISAYTWLQDNGFSQMPTGSAWLYDDQFIDTVKHCSNIITSEKLFGYLQTVWKPTCHSAMSFHLKAINALASARNEIT